MSLESLEPRVLLTGLAIGESSRWHDGRLWFANWGTQEVIAVDSGGNREVVARVPTTIPFSIYWLPGGRMLVVSGPEAVLLRQEIDGSFTPYADLSSLADGFNELVVDGRGNAYVNGGDFNFETGTGVETGVIALATPDGTVRRVADHINFGNGMAVTADNKTLIVAESWARQLSAFDIAADGSLSNRRVWADLSEGTPDGICLDAEGAVWYADVPNRRCVRVREGGEVLQEVVLEQGCFACTLGGEDGKTLFMMTADWGGFDEMSDEARTGRVLSVQVSAPKAGWP